jgi:filamentous hemagglutinin family protein
MYGKSMAAPCNLSWRYAMRLSVSVAALVAAGFAGAASADPLLPSGGHIVAGQATIGLPGAGQMVINQTSSRAVIDWRGFSIGAGGVVQFNNGTGATLNRVLGGDPSSIAGQLRASGSVYLVNPAGVVVDSSGQVLTGGSFVASTRSLGADAFMAGGSLTFVGNGSGGVENRGRIETGGDAVLIGQWVTNTGSISAGGAVGLAAGSRVVLRAAGSDARIYVEGASGDVTTSGAVTAAAAELKAAGGNVYALAGNSGVVRATGVASEDGRILLIAGGDVTVAQGAALVADGSVTVDAGQALAVAGRISTSANTGNTGGGRITLLANDIALTGADIAASGSGNGSGGIVRIGGGRMGGEGLRESVTLKADAATTITADGGATGNGGDVALWSRDWTGFAGTILARGGTTAGNGGEAEVSSRGILGYDGLTDLRAANGNTGTLLLDPYNITISSAASSNVSGLTPTGNDSNINATTLTNALATANVTVSTGLAGSAGSQAGNITVSAPLSWAANQLTLQAAGTITINAAISGGSAASLALSSGNTAGGTTAIGGSGQLSVPTLSTLTAGGAVTLTNTANAVSNFSATTAGGNVSLINTASLTLGASNFGAGVLTINNSGRSVNQSGALTAGGVTASNISSLNLGQFDNAIASLTAPTGMTGSTVTLRNTPTLDLGTINLGSAGLLWLINFENVTQSGPITTDNARISGVRPIVLTNSANAIRSLVLAGGNVTLTNTVALGVSGDFSTLTINNGANAVTQPTGFSGRLFGGGLTLLNSTNVALNNSENGISQLTTTVTGGSINVANSRALTLGTSSLGAATLTISTGANAVTQSGAVTGGTLNITTSNAGVTLTNAANAIGTFGATTAGGNVSLVNAGALTLGASSLGTGTLTISNGANAVTQSGAIAGGTLNITTSNAGVTLTNLSNAISNFSATTAGGNVSLVNNSALTLGASNLGTGTLTIESRSSVQQSGALTAAGVTARNFSWLNLADSGNAIASLTIPTASSFAIAFLRNTGDVDLGTINLGSSGTLDLRSVSGNVTQSGPITADLVTTSRTATLTNSANAIRRLDLGGGNMTLTNTVALAVSGVFSSLTLNNGGNAITQPTGFSGRVFGSSLTLVNSTNVTLNNSENGISQLTTTVTGGSISLTNRQTLTLGTSSLGAATLTISTGANAVTQSGAVTGGTLNITTSNAGVTLTNAANAIGTFGATTAGGNVSLVNAGALTLGASNLGTGTLTVNNGANAIGQSGALTAGTVNVTTSNAGVTLTNFANAFSNFSATTAGGNVSLANTIDLTLGASNLGAGVLTINNGGGRSISQSGALTAGGFVMSSLGSLNLSNVGNAIGALRLDRASDFSVNVTLINTRSLDLGTMAIGTAGSLSLNNGDNPVTQSGALTARNVFIHGNGSGAVTLTNSANTVADLRLETNGNVSITNTRALTVRGSLGQGGTLTISNGANAVSQSGPVTSGAVNITTSNAAVTLNFLDNSIGNLSATTGGGNVSLVNTQALTLGTSNLGTGTLRIGNTGDIMLANGSTLISTAGGDAIVLQTGARFLSPGSGAIDTPQGRFLVFAADPSRLEIAGSLTARTAYGLSAAAYNAGTAVGPAGSRFVFANTPTGLITPTSASRVFDGIAQGLTAFTIATSGGSRFDDASEVLVGTPISQTATDVRRSGGSPTGAVLAYDVGIANLASLTSPIGYQLVGGTGQLTITPRTLVLTPLATTRVYGESNPLTNGFTVELLNGVGNALVGSDALAPTIRIASDAAPTADAGSAFDLTGIGAQFTSGNAGNYRILYDVLAGGLTITPRPITITANAQTRVYGNANPALSLAVGGMGLVNGDTLTGALATTADVRSNVGTYAITRGTLAASANYSITGFTGADLTVTQRPLTITYAAAPTTMVYGDAVPVLGGSFVSMGLVNDDTLSGALQFTTAATPASSVGLYGIMGSGLGASANYSLTVVQAPGNATALTISPAPLTVTVLAGQGKIYGDDDPALVFGTVGLKNDDTVGSVMTGAIARAAGEDVTAEGYAISQGTLAANANYTLGFAGDVFRITPATLAVTADTLRRTYGDADPALTFNVAGLKRTDTLSSLLTGALVRAPGNNVGSYAVSQGSLALASANYTLGFTGSSLTIDPAVLTFTANAASRVYGGSNPRFTGTLTGFVNGETQRTATTGTMVFRAAATPASDVGSYAISGGGLSAQNYVFVQAAANDTALTITPRPLTVAASARTRVYGDANPVLTFQTTGLVNGDSLTGVLATDATVLSDVGSYAITQGTLMASANYILSFIGAQLTINPRPITIRPNAISRVYGNDNPVLTFRIGGRGMANGDRLTGALATEANAQSNVGSYAISQGTLAASSNYAMTFVPGALKVTPRPITITAIGQSRVYGDANPAFGFTVGGSGLVNGDTLTGELATIATETSNIGGYAITLGTLAATANYTLRYVGGRLTVTARPITVFADPQSRVFGTANPPLTYTVGGQGLVNGDVLNGALTTTATTSSRVGNYAINRGTLTGSSNYLMTYVGSTLTVTPTSPPPP